MFFKKLSLGVIGDVLVRLGIGVICLAGIAISILTVIVFAKEGALLLGIMIATIEISVFGVLFLGVLFSFFEKEEKE